MFSPARRQGTERGKFTEFGSEDMPANVEKKKKKKGEGLAGREGQPWNARNGKDVRCMRVERRWEVHGVTDRKRGGPVLRLLKRCTNSKKGKNN